MGTEKDPVTEELPTMDTDKWNGYVEECYAQFFSPQARWDCSKEKSPKLHEFFMRLHNFSTVVEANHATKAGDIGQLMSIWKVWLLMLQALPGLFNYRTYLL
jgi:hypothetical protein